MTALNNYANVFALNDTFMTSINKRAEKCGYFDFMDKALTFPPAGKFTAPNDSASGCDVWDDIVTAAIYVNPCFNIYHLTDVSVPPRNHRGAKPMGSIPSVGQSQLLIFHKFSC